ncbi:MAG TPA: cupin domain-containing protein [Steroidobacteraceae bacterium]|nr:cupin domain-containing protein [Steroidobacteraceae bacterium]
MTQQIVDFRQPLAAETSTPAADRLISGHPQQSIANHFIDSTQQFFSGTWSSSAGKWRIRYTESEFCCLTEGRVVLENLSGERWEFGPGMGFVVPAGFEGTWEVVEPCTKFYAIFEARP